MQYMLVSESAKTSSECAIRIEKRVNALCAKGWEPTGGIEVHKERTSQNSQYTFYQAMIKKEESEGPTWA